MGAARAFSRDFLQSRVVGIPGGQELWAALKKLNLQPNRKFSAEELGQIAEALQVDHIATGSLIKSEHDIIMSLSLLDSKTGETIQSFRAICRGERGLIAGVDELTRKIKLALNIPRRLISHDIDDDVSQSSPDRPKP